MKKTVAALAAAVVALSLATLSGAAFAGDHHGDQGSKHGQKSESAQKPQSSTDQQSGQKPDNTTDHNTSCSTGGGQGSSATCHSDNSSKSDASKRYGNGETAAQIANGKGAPADTKHHGAGE